jgi:hypothetical protein
MVTLSTLFVLLCTWNQLVFNVALKRKKRNYEATSTVAMATSKQLYHGKYICNNQIASVAQFIDTCFYKEKKCPILLLKLVYSKSLLHCLHGFCKITYSNDSKMGHNLLILFHSNIILFCLTLTMFPNVS